MVSLPGHSGLDGEREAGQGLPCYLRLSGSCCFYPADRLSARCAAREGERRGLGARCPPSCQFVETIDRTPVDRFTSPQRVVPDVEGTPDVPSPVVPDGNVVPVLGVVGPGSGVFAPGNVEPVPTPGVVPGNVGIVPGSVETEPGVDGDPMPGIVPVGDGFDPSPGVPGTVDGEPRPGDGKPAPGVVPGVTPGSVVVAPPVPLPRVPVPPGV
jgi:hypothetical protein